MKKKTFKEFNKQYGAFLLRTPHAKFTIADFCEIEKRFWLDIENESIIDELDFDHEKWLEYRDFLENMEKTEASFPDISVERELMLDIQLTIPSPKFNPGLKLNREKINKYEFGDVKAKVLDNSGKIAIRKIIENTLADMSKRDLRKFRKEFGSLKRTYIVDTLYYANSVSISIDRDFSIGASLEADFKDIEGLKVNTGFETSGDYTYTFTGNSKVPFAAEIISLHDL